MAQTPGQTNYGEIQSNEMQVLQSIFMEDFKEEKTKAGAWNKRADRSFRVSLRAPSDPSDELKVVLKVTFPATYPKTLPQLDPSFSDGFPSKARNAISEVIKAKPKELLGQESIFEVSTSIQDALDTAVASNARAQELPALDEERTLREAEAKRIAEEAKVQEQLRQKHAEDEETRNLSEMVDRERARLTKLHRKSESSPEAIERDARGPGLVTFDHEMKAKSADGTTVSFRSIVRRAKYRNGPVTGVSMACSADSDDDCLPCFALKECAISGSGSADSTKKNIQALEINLDSLLQLPHHPTILKPLGFRMEKSKPSKDHAGGIWKVQMLLNFLPRGSLSDLLGNVGTVDAHTARSWVVQILEGLHFLHSNRIVHAQLTPENVLLERSEGGDVTMKLTDFSYQHQLHYFQERSNKFSTAPSAYWSAPEAARDDSMEVSTPRDIWDLGVLLLEMFFGLDVQRRFNSPTALIESNSLSESFETLINKFFKADPKKRPTAFELLASEFLRNEDAVLDDLPSGSISRVTSLQTPSKGFRLRRDSANIRIGASRYASDFVEMGRLGKGGFGEVVKARNKLDGTVYAIKKISQKSAAGLSTVLSEIMLLSRLNNPFIVRYYTAWIEEEDGPSQKNGGTASSAGSESEHGLSHLPDFSTPGLDFISSGGYPGIEFGYDTDDDEEPSEALESEDDDSDLPQKSSIERNEPLKKPSRRRSSATRDSPVMLYIQMEYCENQTLRDLIRGDLYKDVDEIWRLLHQILQGLVHIHQNHVIHRDMKPENIFIDQSNTVRIGDFGLARPGESSFQTSSFQTSSFQTSSFQTSSKGAVAPDLTASVGTSVYVAPEVRSSGGGSYNEKADMYSLGVILFEMSYPLRTAMERAHTLDAMRREPCEFPTTFEEPEKHLQKEIIESLLRHKVSERPSSQELLQSGKIPSQIEDEAVRTALESFSDKSSPFYTKLINSLFEPTKKEGHTAKDYTYDLQMNLKTDFEDLLLQSFIKDRLVEVFRRHGAVETQRPQLLPGSHYYAEAAVRLLDSSGAQVQLPYDLTLPFARMLAKLPKLAGCRKSFAFGNVFRSAPSGVHPYMHGEVDFDIVSTDTLDMALREAEMIKVADEILDSIPSLRGVPIYHQISHSKLLDRIMPTSVTAEQRQAIKLAMSKLYTGQWTWAKIRNQLRSPPTGVSSTVIDDLMQFDFREPCSQSIAKLRSLLQDTEELESTFRHLEAVVTYLQRFRIKRKVFMYPLASLNEQFYRGNMLFQCLLDGHKKRVLCAGGRYDRLIQDQRAEARGTLAHAVGFSFAWESLLESMSKLQKTGGKKFLKKTEEAQDALPKIRRCDVLVDSGDPALLRSSGIHLVQELWDNGISAELVIDAGIREATSQHQANKDHEATTHDWLVMIKQDDQLKVRSLVSQDDVELRRGDFLSWLRGELKDRDRLEGRAAKARVAPYASTAHTDASGAGGGGGGGHEPDVTVLVAQSRGKKTNRRNVVDDAQARAHEAAQAFLAGPIAAVEMKDDVFDGLRATRLTDPDSWRRFVQGAPLAERAYLGQVHDLLLDMARAAKGKERNAWLYNFRTRACLLYDLGRAP